LGKKQRNEGFRRTNPAGEGRTYAGSIVEKPVTIEESSGVSLLRQAKKKER